MKSKIISSVIILFAFFLSNLSCENQSKNESFKEKTSKTEDLEKEKVLKFAKDTALQVYGTMIENELPMVAQLIGDSLWIVNGTLPKNAVGGTVYIEIRKRDNKVLQLTHYK